MRSFSDMPEVLRRETRPPLFSQPVARSFARRRVLLLQGPVGGFFRRLASSLEGEGATVFKVNFNGGDWLFYPRGAMAFRGGPDEWPGWLEAFIRRERIDTLFLFGDCRPQHAVAREIALRAGVELGVFEEGYLRPNFVTLERSGANGYSSLPEGWTRQAQDVARADVSEAPERPVAGAFFAMAWQSVAYAAALWCGQSFFRNYRHHRPTGLQEAACWLRALWRKPLYHWLERGTLETLCRDRSTPFFLVPLQVHNDFQVKMHGHGISDIRAFIRQVAWSFAVHASPRQRLVFKHHPLDRGHADYREFIAGLATELGIGDRTFYVHDQHLPTLLRHAAGVVVINSTVGLSALHHGAATHVVGKAVYDLPGLTYQGTLDQFWRAAPGSPPDPAVFQRFRHYLIAHSQINGSFYKPFAGPGMRAGLAWSSPREAVRVVRGDGRSVAQDVARSGT